MNEDQLKALGKSILEGARLVQTGMYQKVQIKEGIIIYKVKNIVRIDIKEEVVQL